jgi:hypothetical protein
MTTDRGAALAGHAAVEREAGHFSCLGSAFLGANMFVSNILLCHVSSGGLPSIAVAERGSSILAISRHHAQCASIGRDSAIHILIVTVIGWLVSFTLTPRIESYRSARIFELFEVRELRRIESNSKLGFRASNLWPIRFVKIRELRTSSRTNNRATAFTNTYPVLMGPPDPIFSPDPRFSNFYHFTTNFTPPNDVRSNENVETRPTL